MKRKLLICLIFSFAFARIFAQTKTTYEISVDSLIRIGLHKKVIPYLETEIEKQPTNETLLRLIGFQYFQVNNLELSEKYYREALVVNPDCPRCYLNVGRIYAAKNDMKQAISYLDKAVSIDPKDDLLFSNRAQIKERMGDISGALSDHNKAIELAPKSGNNYTERGIYNLKRNDTVMAIADFDKAIVLTPANYYPYYYRSRIDLERGNVEASLKDIHTAISLDDRQDRLFNFRGTVYSRLNQYSRALEDHSTAIKLNPDGFYGYLNRARVYYQMENMDAACQDYTKARALAQKEKIDDPIMLHNLEESISDICDASRASYYYQRGVAFYNLKQYDQALAVYTSGLQKFPKNVMILLFLGNAHLALKDYKNAEANYKLALNNKESLMAEISISPRLAKASSRDRQSYYDATIAAIYYNDATCKIHTKKIEEALILMNKAIVLAPNLTGFNKETYYNRRAELYLEKKSYNLAMTDLDQSIKINKNYALAFINRAIAKVSAIGKGKITSSSISTKLPDQPIRVNWLVKPKTLAQKAEPNMISALEDCNASIALDGNIGFSYYLRGQIKYYLGYSDYCLDLIKASTMGIELDSADFPACNLKQ